jgi:uncharacterized protein YkwD
VAVAVVATAALTAAPAPAATPAALKYGTKVFSSINLQRVHHDRAKLQRSKCLQRFANKQAQAMADQQQMFHQDLGRIQRACHVGWVGENVAYGPFAAIGIVQMWMNSPPHKANILSRHFRLTGVAGRWAGGVWWVSQVFGSKG